MITLGSHDDELGGDDTALWRTCLYSPMRVIIYENTRQRLQQQNIPLLTIQLFSGVFSGITAQLISSPFDLLKIRMQADGHRVAQGQQPKYNGMMDTLRQAWRHGGVKELWLGCVPNCTRAAVVNTAEILSYDVTKTFLAQRLQIGRDDPSNHLISSMVSGFVTSVACTPTDVIRTRVMNDVDGVYKGMSDCLVKTVKAEGVMAMWKGFWPTWARQGPWILIFWVAYEQMLRATGYNSF